jgi:hypothetical protein
MQDCAKENKKRVNADKLIDKSVGRETEEENKTLM